MSDCKPASTIGKSFRIVVFTIPIVQMLSSEYHATIWTIIYAIFIFSKTLKDEF